MRPTGGAGESYVVFGLCKDSLALSNWTVSAEKFFFACLDVSASDFTMDTSADVRFRAGVSIALNPDFSVKTGATFRAEVWP